MKVCSFHVICMLCILFASDLAHCNDVPHPPFRKIWEFKALKSITDEQICDYVVYGNLICFYTSYTYGAVDVSTGKPFWEKPLSEGQSIQGIFCDKDILFVYVTQTSNDSRKVETDKNEIVAYDMKTGKELWKMPLKNHGNEVFFGKDIFFCTLSKQILDVYDVRAKKLQWTLDLSKTIGNGYDENRIYVDPLIMTDRLMVIGVSSKCQYIICLDYQKGAAEWQYGLEKESFYPAADGERICFVQDSVIKALDLHNGSIEWSFDFDDVGNYTKPVFYEKLILFETHSGYLYALNAADGKFLWRQRTNTELHNSTSPPIVFNGTIFVTSESHLHAFDVSGNRLWNFDTEEDLPGSPLKVVEDGFYCLPRHSIIRFSMGSPPELPVSIEKRRAVARELVDRLSALNKDETRLLCKLGNEAFEALIPRLLDVIRKYESGDREQGDNILGDNTRDILMEVVSKENTPFLLSLYEKSKSSDTRTLILDMLAKKGDEEKTIPIFLDILKKERPQKSEAGYIEESFSLRTAIDVINKTDSPQAVSFLIGQLSNPGASLPVREAAFQNLARIGGDEGIRAVMKAKDRERTIPTVEEFISLQKLGTTTKAHNDARDLFPEIAFRKAYLVDMKKDKNGVIRGLFVSGIYGSRLDIWIAKREGSSWIKPIFTGVSAHELPGLFSAKAKCDWIKSFVENDSLVKDSDNDGLSDLVEKRLGTDPGKSDTDGDGQPDRMDRNPLAAPRELTDKEKVMQTAFEAVCIFSEQRYVPCIVELPEGIEPLEFSGYKWVIIPEKPEKPSPLSKIQGRGAAVVGFNGPLYDFKKEKLPLKERREPILFNKDRTQARLGFLINYGYLESACYDVHLKKVGDQWVVIRVELLLVS